MIHEIAVGFEKYPHMARGKKEEHLRDHIIMILEPNFACSITGETFNKTGKTDILIKYEGTNVFIAECKFWSGPKSFLNAIDQILTYLTWRDSKSALLIFVKRKEISKVKVALEETITKHPNYISLGNQDRENWDEYIFCLEGDKGHHIYLAVMLIHISE